VLDNLEGVLETIAGDLGIKSPLTPALSPRGEGVSCGPSAEVERNSSFLSPLRDRDRVRGSFR
jgi:hypothetical protein